jgi:hypothetical protein
MMHEYYSEMERKIRWQIQPIVGCKSARLIPCFVLDQIALQPP